MKNYFEGLGYHSVGGVGIRKRGSSSSFFGASFGAPPDGERTPVVARSAAGFSFVRYGDSFGFSTITGTSLIISLGGFSPKRWAIPRNFFASSKTFSGLSLNNLSNGSPLASSFGIAGMTSGFVSFSIFSWWVSQ